MLKISRYLSLFCIVVLLSTLMACRHGSSGGQEGKTASAKVTVAFQTPSQAAKHSPFIGTINDITSITVDVLRGSLPVITGQQLTYSNGVWSGTLQDLPVGPALTFVGHAYNASVVEIFTGTTVQTMTGNNDAVTIVMAPVTNGIPQTFPRITRIVVPAEIYTSGTVTVGVLVEAGSGETLAYAVTAASGGGSFNPSSGTITLSGTTATLVMSYTAPATAGTYTHTIRMTNSQANWVQTNFGTVIMGMTSPSVGMQFAPVITAIGAKRTGSNVTFTAEVSDAGPFSALTYSWGFDGGLSFIDSTTNPAVLQGYDASRSGNLTVTVTNGAGGATTVSYFIAQWLLPDNVTWTGTSGTLDTTFNGQGWVTHTNAGGGNGENHGYGITTDSSGRILVAGFSHNAAYNYDMVIWRYNSDGTLDTTFNGQGWVTFHNAAGGNYDDVGYSITLDSSGRILVAGDSSSATGGWDMVVWRYNADGTLDTTFNGQGWVVHNGAAGGNYGDTGNGITTDTSGRILVAGYSYNAAYDRDMVIWRYNSDGTLDTTFNGQGWVVHNNAAGGNSSDYGSSITQDSNGRILVTGLSYNATYSSDMVIWRYNADGTLDTTFNGQGWIVHNSAAGGNYYDGGYGITLDASGRILVAGDSSSATGSWDMVIWRYNTDGTLDTTFNGQGWIVHNSAAGGNNYDSGRSITLDSSGRILVTGLSYNATSTSDMAMWRYNPDGTRDTTFNGTGWVIHNNAAGGNGYDGGFGITVDSSGMILVAGDSYNTIGTWDMVIWRYNP